MQGSENGVKTPKPDKARNGGKEGSETSQTKKEEKTYDNHFESVPTPTRDESRGTKWAERSLEKESCGDGGFKILGSMEGSDATRTKTGVSKKVQWRGT